ncbi:50S ribosomal protein L23 [Candidatus Vampirococcus lugosii]|uniref:Large ribosomal subunit protein uL23 n=1 Tax=Candidatus Vampirococcus lugosii TaxID=2789015 RepID=A0ABS5QKX8_9BACT|nr:50S ribosomal protein L23 [Candidatus Vampirococcus lugosii]MBS8121870.1 50S ribosomal protein L23 [Candidatus Vampirococcus lugosii]
MTFKNILRKRAKKSVSTNVLNKISVYDVIIKPIRTEKTYKQTSDLNKYYFKVNSLANKNDVKVAIKEVFGVSPVSVNIQKVPYKLRARKGLVRRSYKRAIVTLNSEDKIDKLSSF